MPEPGTTGLIRHADLWSRIGLPAGLALGLALGVAEATYWAVEPSDGLVPPQFRAMVIVGLAVLVICSLAVQLAVRIIRWQRRIHARLVEAAPQAALPDNVVAFELGRKVGARAGAPTMPLT